MGNNSVVLDMSQAALDSKLQCNSFSSAVGFDKGTEGLYCTRYIQILLDEYLGPRSQRNADLRCTVPLEVRFEKL